MKPTLTTLLALPFVVLAQTSTPTPTPTNDLGPPWASPHHEHWSSMHHSLLSASNPPSPLPSAPFPTQSYTYGPGQGPWGPKHHGGGKHHWGGPNGAPPFGTHSLPWYTNSGWRTGPWTHWWDGTECPASDWPGWTVGPWRTEAPWTTCVCMVWD
ncbi:hypothetical protein BDW02DRAFT_355390 [Decorospora gaudefroyi]|uniref:Uncharacterized protein n=1 Tax=Decorospora gaudefroyi TaxID=184978 RepID=A0A6A5KCB1_9PLEO|nr:hypothetical protein BDW02DRAFT_355390 [Decorospora gaudefroyi]